MTYDPATTSTLEIETCDLESTQWAAGSPVEPIGPRRARPRRSLGARPPDAAVSDASLAAAGEMLPAYDVDRVAVPHLERMVRRGLAAHLELAAAELVRQFGEGRPVARLIEDPDSAASLVVLVARTRLAPDAAVDALFALTATDWWHRLVEATDGALVVDVECA